jgi:hypothetical protein
MAVPSNAAPGAAARSLPNNAAFMPKKSWADWFIEWWAQ